MKKYILKSLFVSVLCMLAASCQDTEFAEAVDSSKAQVMFSIAMDSPAARSRANWGQDYSQTSDLGDEYDNRIDLDQFIVKIEADGKTYNVTDIIKWKEGESNEHKFVGIVKTQNDENVGDITLQKAKISVYANMGTDANANFASMTFDQDAENIPMWGALTVENLKFAPGKRTSVDDIYLLRAMAKFQVTLGDAAIEKGYTLTKASLNKFNLTGFNMPTGYAGAESTMALDMEGVLNENTTNPAGGVTELTEATEDGKGWVIYLPEISNTTVSELKMLLTFSNGSNEKIETEVSVKDYTTANTGLVNIVRNHWYKYVIEDIVNAKPVVKYETLDWERINIEVGGEGYLYLNKDVIEIFNANVDANQLTFSSSSPIASIVLKDVYNHTTYLDKFDTYLDGTNDEDKDQTYAYYINKFGNKIQLGTDPEHPETQEAEQTILSKIKAKYNEGALNGGITIYSPFVADPTNDTQALQHDSHYNAIRYLEFEVTNEQGSTADFRVMQYPSVVITNEEGFYSYRDDFCYGHHEDNTNGEPHNFRNFQNPAYFIAGYQNYDIHIVDPSKSEGSDIIDGCIPQNLAKQYHEKEPIIVGYGQGGMAYKTQVDKLAEFRRTMWPKISASKDQAMGPKQYLPNLYDRYEPHEALAKFLKDNGTYGWFRKHYTGNMVEVFASKVVQRICREDMIINDRGWQRTTGQADIFYTFPTETESGWKFGYRNILYNVDTKKWVNPRIYHIKTKNVNNEYNIGFPSIDVETGYVEENKVNEKLVSPSFMVASQLGATEMPTEDDECYANPTLELIYDIAKEHCKQYVEVTFIDKNGDGIPDEGEEAEVYDNWRLPTKSEIDLIINYQNNSRAMDVLLTGEQYLCITDKGSDPLSNVIPTHSAQEKGYFVRCVRDVKEENNNN